MNLRTVTIYFICITVAYFAINTVSAVHPFSIAEPFSISEKPQIGAIIAREKEKYRLTNIEYDANMAGVVVDYSDLIVEYETDIQGAYSDRYVVESGEADVLVNDSNGQVKKGEYITSSDIPGQGMRVDQDGIVLGIALEDFEKHENTATDMVRTAINIRFTTVGKEFTAEALFAKYGIFGAPINAILGVFKVAPDKLSQTPTFFRYVLSILLLLVSLVFGFILFGRVALRGIDSLGRNPLARWTIFSGIFINIIFIILMIGFALFLAYIILTL